MNQDFVRVAYVDDQETVRLGIQSLLEKTAEVKFTLSVGSGKELLDGLRASSTLPEVCMLDIRMREMDGFLLVDALKREWPKMPILILTSYDVEHYIIRMIRKGINAYLLKDCSPREIVTALFDIRDGGYYHSDHAKDWRFRNANVRELTKSDFTERDIEFLKYCCSEMSYALIAQKMGVTTRSVEGYRDKLFNKYGLSTRVALVFLAMRNNLVPIDIIYQV